VPRSAVPAVKLLGAQLAIGAAAIFARYALTGAGPLAVSALRLGIATAVVVGFAVPFTRISRRREAAFVAAGVALAVHFGCWIASLAFTSVAASTLLVTTTPLWIALYDAARTRRIPSASFIAALALALVGTATIVRAPAATIVAAAPQAPFGDALALAGSLAIGAYLIIVRDAGARHDRPLATPQIVARTYGWATLALIVVAFAAGDRAPVGNDGRAWGGIVAMALVSQTLGHTALNAALRTFSPGVVALTTLLEPVVAALLARMLFGEALTAATIAGGVTILCAVAIALIDAQPITSGRLGARDVRARRR